MIIITELKHMQIMKRFFLMMMFSFFTIGFAQQGSTNRFDQESSKNIDEFNSTNQYKDENNEHITQKGPGNPGDPVPIDNYIPLLIITAVGIMVYHTSQRKNISAKKEPNH